MLKEMKIGENVDFGVCTLKVFGAVTHKLLPKKKLALTNNMDDYSSVQEVRIQFLIHTMYTETDSNYLYAGFEAIKSACYKVSF